jgi:UDP-glucose:(heptosyl)LPS alpha-1,3-glucosyltransferase
MDWVGDIPNGVNVSILPERGLTNHQRSLNFARQAAVYLINERADIVVGFNKMPNLDVYFAADPCYKARVIEGKSIVYRMRRRYRAYTALERAVFEPASKTHILLIAEGEREKFIKYYSTPEHRFHSLPPGISADRRIHDRDGEIRKDVRRELKIRDDEILLLTIGSSFKTKGLDRSLIVLASLPDALRKKTKLYVIGEGNARPFKKMARQLNVDRQVFFLGGRFDVPRFLAGADLLLHPAYSENTGTVLIEAMASGLPVLATDVCGYAFHVKKAEAGLLIPSPFNQKVFNNLLEGMLTSPERETWRKNGLRYSEQKDFFGMHEKAADIIELVAWEKGSWS